MRITQQRRAIVSTLINGGRPLSVSEILAQAQSKVAKLGVATVYRNLKVLQNEGQIVQVCLPDQPPRWEITPVGHHHHFLCETCDKLFEIQGCPDGLNEILPRGYTLAEHDILLRGQCDVCSKKNPNHKTSNMATG